MAIFFKDDYFTKEALDNVLNKTKPGLKTVAHMKFLLFGTKVNRITFTPYDVERYKLDKLVKLIVNPESTSFRNL